jgi:regulator of sirC expression with transglutaminase-like and TPR domain
MPRASKRVKEIIDLILNKDDESCALAKLLIELVSIVSDPNGNQERYGLARLALSQAAIATDDFEPYLEEYLNKTVAPMIEEQSDHEVGQPSGETEEESIN